MTKRYDILPEVLELLRDAFKERLEAKTSWGRNEVWTEFQAAIGDALAVAMNREIPLSEGYHIRYDP